MKHENNFSPFYARFLELCNKAGKSPGAIAKEAGISSGSPTAWKNGAVPKPAQRMKLCEYFGVSENYLLGYEQKDNTPAASSDRDVDRFMDLFTKLTPEQQERELAYLQQLVDAQDK